MVNIKLKDGLFQFLEWHRKIDSWVSMHTNFVFSNQTNINKVGEKLEELRLQNFHCLFPLTFGV